MSFCNFQLMRSQVQGNTGLHGDSLTSLTRTSKTGWLQDSFDPVVEKMTYKASIITKLNANTWNDESELLQVMTIPKLILKSASMSLLNLKKCYYLQPNKYDCKTMFKLNLCLYS